MIGRKYSRKKKGHTMDKLLWDKINARYTVYEFCNENRLSLLVWYIHCICLGHGSAYLNIKN
jgi:hypothetical protein